MMEVRTFDEAWSYKQWMDKHGERIGKLHGIVVFDGKLVVTFEWRKIKTDIISDSDLFR